MTAEFEEGFAAVMVVLIVDCISLMGGDDSEVNEWGIDLCVSTSQKCQAVSPGLSSLSINETIQRQHISGTLH